MERKPLVKERLQEELRAMVLGLRSREPVRIATERELAERFQVSRVSVRSAMKALTEEGLLVQHQGRGTYVCPLPTAHPLYMLLPQDMKAEDPYYSRFLLELSAAAARSGVPLAMVDPARHGGDPEGVLVVMGVPDDALLARSAPLYRHVAVLQGGADAVGGALAASYDDTVVGRQAARELLGRGHRRLVHLAGPAKYPSASSRRTGFEAAVREAPDAQVVVVPAKMNWAGGYQAGEAVLRLLAEPEPPTGIFAANDWMAAGLVQRLKEMGIRLPEQVSVVGCDDIPQAAEFQPPLATFRLDMGKLAEVFLEEVQGLGLGEPIVIRLHPAFIERDSIGSPSYI